jgi:hypothetical protein
MRSSVEAAGLRQNPDEVPERSVIHPRSGEQRLRQKRYSPTLKPSWTLIWGITRPARQR